jgi:cell division protein FtsL
VSPAEAERERLLARAAGGAVDDAEPARREPDQTERHLRLVDREVWRKRNRRHAAISAAIAGIAVVCLALVALHVLIAENQFRLDHLQQQASVQQARYEKLRLQVAQLEAPARIVSAAEGKLGMRQPGSVTYLPATSLPATSLAGTATPPAARPTPTSAAPAAAKRPGGAGARSRAGTASGAVSGETAPALLGDADWPTIKQYLSGSP